MTRVFGVMGHPIDHSLSPAMHQAAFRALGLDAIYAPFDVPRAQLASVLQGLVAAGIDGLNVTVPLKEAVLPCVDALQREARILRAVNTLVIRQGRLIGYNTDVEGFAKALAELGWRPKPCAALLLGAGGAAKAVAWALTRTRGIRLTIANRHRARAEALVRWLRRQRPGCHVAAQSLREAQVDGQDLLVNATSVGMHPGDVPPIDVTNLSRRAVVYDLVYHRTTPLVQAARRRGCLATNGVSMLVYQGAASFRLWWHREPPIAVMRQAVERAIRTRQAG